MALGDGPTGITGPEKDDTFKEGGDSLEDKIVLSIGIRLIAEKYMVTEISDPAFVNDIGENQTSKLFEKFRENFPNNVQAIDIIQQVMLMTPENIHLNSFMYEPILYMGGEHLKKLYGDVQALV